MRLINKPNEQKSRSPRTAAAEKGIAYGTLIMMHDGTIEKVEDVKVGDELMGDDSEPRTVIKTNIGIRKLYKIVPIKGESYVVTGDHILSLKYTNAETIWYDRKRKRLCAYYAILESEIPVIRYKVFQLNGKSKRQKEREAINFLKSMKGKKLERHDIVNISVENYLNLNMNQQNILKWYRVGVEFPEVELDFDPYMLGIWLGDGSSNEPRITTADQEIVDYFKKKLVEYNCIIIKRKEEYSYYIKQSNGFRHRGNKMLNFLKDNNLINNKHIPDAFKYNSRENRLKLLAGLIDSDGYYAKGDSNIYDFCMSKNYPTLIDDMVYLIRSLGFATYKTECIKVCTNGNNGPVNVPCYRFKFSGIGQEDIPCLLERKQSKQRTIKKSNMVTGITIEKQGIGKYIDLQLDGGNRFLLGDFSVAHN